MRSKLVTVLAQVGKRPEVIAGAGGSHIVVLPYGGRVLGLFAAGRDENFLWTNPALASAETARAFYQSSRWHNSGGDRTWLAPEMDFFLPQFPDTSVYFQPRQLDPGQYQLRREDGGIRLVNQLVLRSSRTGEAIKLRITKHVSSAEDPLRYEHGVSGLNGLQFAGYTLETCLELCETPAVNGVGLWHLLQLPHGGEMLIPTYARSRPRVCFGKVPSGELSVEEHLVRYRMRAHGENKISIRAVAATGRVGYLYSTEGVWSLVVRSFSVDPSGHYADAPWDDPGDLGYAVQVCSVSSDALGRFSELEYHAPAIGGPSGRVRSSEVSRVWAFRGPAGAVGAAARALLGVAKLELHT